MKLIFVAILFAISLSATAQNGMIISKTLIELRTDTIWKKIAPNDTLVSKYEFIQKINLYEIVYISDSLEIKGYLCEPKAAGVYPTIIYNRGGNRNYGSLTTMSIISVTGKLAAEGYVILASQYRGAKGAKGRDEFGGNDVHDILNIAETAKRLPNVDSTRMALFGWSRGGMMTYLTLQQSGIFKAAVISNGVTNMIRSAGNRPTMEHNVYAQCIPNYWENRRDELKKRSVIFWADELPSTTSYLIVCGTQDTLVSPAHSRNIAKKLERMDYDVEFHEFETDHKFSNKKDELFDLLLRWFNEKLCDFVQEDL